MIDGAIKAKKTVTNQHGLILDNMIQGVVLRDDKHVVTRNSLVTEIYRNDWGIGSPSIAQVTLISLRVGHTAAWHCHERQLDQVICIRGTLKVGLYDSREGSPTYKQVNSFHLSEMRPQFLVVPPGVWHGFKNVSHEPATFINCFDRAFSHEDPDEWGLPADTDKIPFKF